MLPISLILACNNKCHQELLHGSKLGQISFEYFQKNTVLMYLWHVLCKAILCCYVIKATKSKASNKKQTINRKKG